MAESQAGDLIATYRVIATSSPFLCGDCGMPTDLGFKCRACYSLWSRELWSDVPREQRRLIACFRDLRSSPAKREIARHALDGKGEQLSGDEQKLLDLVRTCHAGPFSQSMTTLLTSLVAAKALDGEPATPKAKRELLR
jgi:hypothetical protein